MEVVRFNFISGSDAVIFFYFDALMMVYFIIIDSFLYYRNDFLMYHFFLDIAKGLLYVPYQISRKNVVSSLEVSSKCQGSNQCCRWLLNGSFPIQTSKTFSKFISPATFRKKLISGTLMRKRIQHVTRTIMYLQQL